MPNAGLKRGLGTPSGLAPLKNVWGNRPPPVGGSGGYNSGFTNYTGLTPIPYYYRVDGPVTNQGQSAIGFGIDDYRYINTNGPSSGILADNSAALKVWGNPQFTPNVTTYGYTGIAASSFIGFGLNAAANSLLTGGRMAAFACHWDTAIPVFGLYGLQIHLGLVQASGQNAQEVVGIDLGAMNSFGATTATAIFIRNANNISDYTGSPWNMQLGYYPSQHQGPLGIGGLTYSTIPGFSPNGNTAAGGSMLDVVLPGIVPGTTQAGDIDAISALPCATAATVTNCTVTAASNGVTSSAGFGSVVVGQYVTGIGVVPGTTVVQVLSTSSIVLSNAIQNNTSTTATLVFSTPNAFTVVCTLASSTTITSSAGFGSVVVGQFVAGPGILVGTIVTAVGSTSSITVNQAAVLTGSETLTFYTASPVRQGRALAQLTTTNATATTIYGDNPLPHLTAHYRFKVWARRTGGSSGSADDSVAFMGDCLVSNQALVGSPFNAAALQPVAMGTLPGSFTAATAATTIGSNTVTSTAAFGSVQVGQLVTGTGIPPGAWVIAKASSSSITISQAAVATGSALTLTFCSYYVSVTASIFGTVLQVAGPAATNVTWHAEIERSGWIST